METFSHIGISLNYEVSNEGRIKNSEGMLLAPQFDKKGYQVLYIYFFGNLVRLYVHRIVASLFVPNPFRHKFVDHIDGNRTNNKSSNLRWCTPQQNCYNKSKTTSTTSSKYKGVYKKNDGTFQSHIMHNYKKFHLGTFVEEKDAAIAYNNKAKELFGEFSKLNFL